MEEYDVAIIGAGPGGLTAGIYCARYGLKTIIIEKGITGGTTTLAGRIHNYPGFIDTSGMELMKLFEEQAKKAGAIIENEAVSKIIDKNESKEIQMQEKTIKSKVVIVSVGAKSKWLKVKGEKEYLNKGVHFCATCDGPMYNGKEVVVIGSDNRASEEAIYLSTVTKKATLISPKKELTADAAKQKALAERKIDVVLGAIVTSFEGKGVLSSITLKTRDGKEEKLSCSGAFVYIGSEPNTEFVNVKKDPEGRIIVNSSMETSVKGILACGDCIKKDLYQIATCVGEGATAAFTASKYIHNQIGNE